MNLYHFTPAHLAPHILREGLTRGVVPLSIDPPSFLGGCQWLTTRKERRQSWAEGTGRLPYSRTEVRLKIVIPRSHRDRLVSFPEWKKLTPLGDVLSAYGDPENWLVYRGTISPRWIARSSDLRAERP